MIKNYHSPVFSKVLMPVLHGCVSDSALAAARTITGDGEVILLGLVLAPPDESLSTSALRARQVRQTIRQLTDGDRVYSHGRVHVSNRPIDELDEVIREEGIDLLVLEWPCHFQALGVSPSEAMEAITCDVAIVRGPFPSKPSCVLVPIRGGPYAELSLRLSLAIAENSQARLAALHVTSSDTAPKLEAPFRGLARVLKSLPEVEYLETQTDDPVGTILQAARGYDLVVIGATARPENQTSTIGPVAGRILHECTAGVMIVKTRRPMPASLESELVGQAAISVLVDKWFAENTYHADEFTDLQELLALKNRQGVSISLALPALNEERTVGSVIQTIKSSLMEDIALLDEIVLMDSNSTDRTRQIAAELGIPVHIHQKVLDRYGARSGKGEALWKSLYVTRGDIVIWIDTDIVNIHPRFVYGLLGPLLVNPRLQFIKGFYRRPIKVGEKIQEGGGGRVTELTARPLLNLFYPELSGLIQPLSGEYGGRRPALEKLPFSSGYGVEIGLLVDVFDNYGLNTIAQVDLTERIHHNQPLESLSKMSFAIIQTMIRKLERRYGRAMLEEVNKTMKLIRYEPGRFFLDIEEIAEQERPPMIDLPEYLGRYDR
jgi:glucosyl-3-phosphoglycerate synthase